MTAFIDTLTALPAWQLRLYCVALCGCAIGGIIVAWAATDAVEAIWERINRRPE